jgi:exodeoxyribonuclease III
MLRIVTYNLLVGFQDRSERKPQALEWIAATKPDVFAMQEMNEYTPERLSQEALQWGHAHSLLLKTDGYSPALSSRTPIENPTRFLNGYSHGVLYVRTRGIDIFVLHLTVRGWAQRLSEAAQVITHAKKSMEAGRHTIILGDFNALSPLDAAYYASQPGVREYQRLCDRQHGWSATNNGELDFSVMESFAAAEFVDVVAQRTQSPNKRLTYPTPLLEADPKSGSHLLRGARLDYILVSPGLAERCVRADVINDEATSFQSDHYPVLAEFEV